MADAHVHAWVRETSTYAPPLEYDENRMKFVRPSDVPAMYQGATILVLRCADPLCGEIKTVQLLGKEVKEPPSSHG
jgi:hypothetical protein